MTQQKTTAAVESRSCLGFAKMLPTRHARVQNLLNLVLRFEPAVLNLVPLSREVPNM